MDSQDRKQIVQDWSYLMPPRAIGYRLRVVAQLAARKFQSTLDPYGISIPQWIVLTLLWQHDGQTITELTKELHQFGGTMSGLLKGMEVHAAKARAARQTHLACMAY